MLNRAPKKVNRNQATGKAGEDLAVHHLKRLGFGIKDRNFRTRWGEVDIIASKGEDFYFIEVKTRKNLDYGHPIESFPFYRVERLKKMAVLYASTKRLLKNVLHLSLLGIDCSGPEPRIHFLPDIIT